MQSNSIHISDVITNPSKNLYNLFYANEEIDLDEINNEISLKIQNTEYFTENDFVNHLESNNFTDTTHLKIISVNICNVLSKLNGLESMMSNISTNKSKPNIIAITETHLQRYHYQGYSIEEIKNLLSNYTLFHTARAARQGGGVGFFIDGNLVDKCSIVTENLFTEEIFEGIALKIPKFIDTDSPTKKDLILLNIYRPPNPI